jgi:hypothetical protein
MILIKAIITGCVLGLLLAGCTSLGYETRTIPKISKEIEPVKEFGFDADRNELSIGIKNLLLSRGYKIQDSLKTQYVIRVRSEDLDTCIPEGSRQMHFNLTVIDSVTGDKYLQIADKYGCKNTIISRFNDWLNKMNP